MSEQRVWLRSSAIRDFRNLEQVDMDFPEAGLAIVGENGQGKTNLLEAIYYLQVLRSARGARDQDVVRFGTRGFHIALNARIDAEHVLGVGFDLAGRKKRVTMDGLPLARMSDAFGALPSVMFSPRDIQLVAGSPGERRRYLDLVLALSSRKYLSALQQYRAALLQRNAALRDATRSGSGEDAVAAWEPALAESGAVIVCDRAAWVAEHSPEFTEICVAIGEEGDPRMAYHSSFAREGDVREMLATALDRQRQHDLRRGMTHAGPHRDDLLITLASRDLRAFGSAGQQRTAAIALRMLEAATLRSTSRLEPLLLLDDPFAELDVKRSERILGLLQNAGLGQTILCVPRAADIPEELVQLERVRIESGTILQTVA
ncbi:MAG TPA: DNA replication and repair protein RecF [Gemmatimonadaceae bacterium]|nr:DNA replication and repair protein RecF [Gemmatimonadaceae bacterium]